MPILTHARVACVLQDVLSMAGQGESLASPYRQIAGSALGPPSAAYRRPMDSGDVIRCETTVGLSAEAGGPASLPVHALSR